MKEDSNERLLPMQSKDKGTTAYRRHGIRFIQPAAIGAIEFQGEVTGLKNDIELFTHLFDKRVQLIVWWAFRESYDHHHFTRYPIKDCFGFAHYINGVTRHPRSPPVR